MGLNSELVILIISLLAPLAYSKTLNTRPMECVIVDLLIYIRACILFAYNKEQNDGLVTGSEIVTVVWDICHRFFRKHASVVVLIMDDPECTPRQKEETQKKRNNSKSKPLIQYPPASKFTDEGICFPDPQKPGMYLPPERFDLESTLRNKVQRKKLALYIAKSLESRVQLEPGQYVVFQHSNGVATNNYGLPGQPFAEFCDFVDSFAGKARHGEFDTSSVFWGSMFVDKYPIRIKTKDTDMIPIWCCFIDKMQRMGKHVDPMIWEYDTDRSCDITNLWNTIKSKEKLDIYSWMTLCALCGNDYLFKNWTTNNIGVSAIYESIKRSKEVIAKDPSFTSMETLELIIRWCHTQVIDGAKFTSIATLKELTHANGARKKRKRKSQDSNYVEDETKKKKLKIEEKDEDGDEDEEVAEEEQQEEEEEEPKRSINDALVREKVAKKVIHQPSEALFPYSHAYIENYWLEKKSKKFTGMPTNTMMKMCIERLRFSLWFWEHQPFTNQKWEETLNATSFENQSKSSSSSSSSTLFRITSTSSTTKKKVK
jgi:hypothetical protein